MFCREIQLLVQARHPNIVATYGLCMTEGYEDRLTQVPKSLALVMELMPHITNKQDGDSWLALINYHADAKHAPGKEFMDESRSKMTATSDTPTIFFYPNPCKKGGALDLKARGYDIPQKRPMKAAAVGKKNKWPRKAAAAGFFKKKNEATKRSAPISPETHGQMLITNFLTRM